MPVLLTNILITTLAAAIFLMVRGFRGRTVGSTPHCRKCNFSLEGARQDARCPECGRDLTGPKAVRTGRFERRRITLACGWVMLVLSVVGLATAFFRSLTNLIPDLPTPMVVWASGSKDHELAGTALRELQDRAAANQLSDHTIRLLAMQGIKARDERAPGRGWFWPYATFFELAHRRGLVSQEEWTDYAANSLYVMVIATDRHKMVNVHFSHYLVNPQSGVVAPVTLDIEVPSLEYQGTDGVWTALDVQPRNHGPGAITHFSVFFNPEDYGCGQTVRVRFKARVVDAVTRTPIGGDWDGELAFPMSGGLWTMRRKDGQRAVDVWRY